MKTIKIILSIAGFALTSICSIQLLSQNNNEVLVYSAHYNLASNRVEHRVEQFPARTTSGDYFEAPLVNRTYYIPIELDMDLEAWMTRSFESSFYEEDMQLESWMVSPFENIFFEEDPIIEKWMTRPFELEEEIEIEAWMTTSWI